jgi:3-hydroxyacyl-CoA dehydrogenase
MEQEKEQVPQQPNPEYQEQFDSQAFWANSFAEDQSEYKLENPTKMDKLLHRKLKFPVKMTPIDMAHAEALKVDSLVEEAHKHGYTPEKGYTSQKLAETILKSSEFGLKTPDEIFRRQMLIQYYPEIVKKVYEGDIRGATKMLDKEIHREGIRHNNLRYDQLVLDVKQALVELVKDGPHRRK